MISKIATRRDFINFG